MSEVYRITVKGHLDAHWSASFGGLTITQNDRGETILTGRLADQAALHGVLDRLCDLNLPLISLNRLDLESQDWTEAQTSDPTPGASAKRGET